MTQQSNVRLRAARDGAARVNSTTVHNVSHPAARHKTAAASREEMLVHAAGSVSRAVTLKAVLRVQQRRIIHPF